MSGEAIIGKAARVNLLALALMLPIAMVAGYAYAGVEGLIGAGLGVGLGFGFFLITALSVTLVSSRAPKLVEAVVLGGWLVKLLLFILIFAALRDAAWMNDVTFALSVATAALLGLAIEVFVVIRAKGTYVTPE